MVQANRKPEHVALSRPIRIFLSSVGHVDASLVDLSMEGVGVEYAAPADANTQLKLYMELAVNNQTRGVHFRGVVKHTHVCRGRFFIWLDFAELASDDRAFINSYIQQRIHRDCAQFAQGILLWLRYNRRLVAIAFQFTATASIQVW